jgi:hypothetical protein
MRLINLFSLILLTSATHVVALNGVGIEPPSTFLLPPFLRILCADLAKVAQTTAWSTACLSHTASMSTASATKKTTRK